MDRQGWTYWMFDGKSLGLLFSGWQKIAKHFYADTRLYRELPMNLLQRKTITLLESTDFTFELVSHSFFSLAI